jgi:transitional endoplasmic reticulum ATPase
MHLKREWLTNSPNGPFSPESLPHPDLKGLYLGHAAENVRDTFEKARAVSPTILFIDELVIVTPRRDGGSSNDALAQKIVSQMLQEMDVIVSQRRQVFVLAATNHPENIDDAILSRFTNALRFPFQMLDKAKMKKTTSAEEVLILGQLSEGMSNRYLKNWVSLAQRIAVGRAIVDPDRYDLIFDDLMSTIPEAARSRPQDPSSSARQTAPIL